MSNKKDFKKFSTFPESVGSIASANTGGKINPEQHSESEREKILEFWNDLVKRTASVKNQGEEIIDFILSRDKAKDKQLQDEHRKYTYYRDHCERLESENERLKGEIEGYKSGAIKHHPNT